MTALSPWPWVDEKEELRTTSHDPTDTDPLITSINDCQALRSQSADDFETWYAEYQATAGCDEPSWLNEHVAAKESEEAAEQAWMCEVTRTEEPEVLYFDSLDPTPQKNLSSFNESVNTGDDFGQFDFYYDCSKDLARVKKKTRNFKLSKPPTLPYFSERHIQKLEWRTKARKTTRQNVNSCWAASDAKWAQEVRVVDHQGSLNNPYDTLHAHDFEPKFSGISWSEGKLLERLPELKKYRPYQASLLRWCCKIEY